MITKQKACPHCGALLTRPRSEADHRRFFALIAAAYHQWPELHDFQPDDAEHLRAWLLCKAGYKDTAVFDLPDTDDPVMLAQMMAFAEQLLDNAGDSRHTFGRWIGSTMYVHKARSIAWDKLSQKGFAPIREAIEDIVSYEIGVPADQLLREASA